MQTNLILKRPVHVSHELRREKEAIRRLLTFERFCRDNSLWEEMRTCYTSDATVVSSWFKGGANDFITALSQRPGRAPHKIHSILVWTHGNRGIALMETTLTLTSTIQKIPVEANADCQLLYRLIRINGEWYVDSWTTIFEQDHLIPAYPTSALDLNPEEMSKFRSSCRCMAYLHKMQGLTFYDDLPGIDDQGSLEKVYQEADLWLQNG